MHALLRSATGLLVLAACLLARDALADDEKEACAAAAERAQALRKDGKLREARAELVTCARDACPRVVRPYCAQWLAEVEAALPTVVVRARDGRDHDVIGVRVWLDGKALSSRLDGNPIAVDPGAHHLRYQAAEGSVVEEDVLVTAAEKNRILTVHFTAKLKSDGTLDHEPETSVPPAQSSAPSSSVPATALPVGASTESSSRSSLVLPYVLGGVGVAALGVFGVLDYVSWSDAHSLRDGCGQSHACAQSQVDAVQVKIDVAAVSLGVGLVALGAATWMLLSRSTGPKPARLGFVSGVTFP